MFILKSDIITIIDMQISMLIRSPKVKSSQNSAIDENLTSLGNKSNKTNNGIEMLISTSQMHRITSKDTNTHIFIGI